MAKVHLEVDMPDDELPEFARALHAWDDGRTEILSRIWVTHTSLTPDQITAVLFYRQYDTRARTVFDDLRKALGE